MMIRATGIRCYRGRGLRSLGIFIVCIFYLYSRCTFQSQMSSSINVTLVGATGLVGKATFQSLLTSPSTINLTTLTRRAIPPPSGPSFNPDTKHTNTVFPDLFTVPSTKTPIAEKGGVYISCLGSTRAAAGGVEAQEQLDHGLNRDIARRARENGAETVGNYNI
jgi:uncharacterized protein YbjT (DUF2867 family)